MFGMQTQTTLYFVLMLLVKQSLGLSHSQAVSRLSAAGISVFSSGNCSNRNNPNCTSLEGVRDNTIAGLITLKRASRCPLIVTGGTEAGHGSGAGRTHGNGYKADIGLNSCINSYIQRSFTYKGVRSDGATLYQSAAGNIYAKEGNHWDIAYV